MAAGKQKLSTEWHERFQDVNKLNEYAKTNKITLKNALIENYIITGATIIDGEFVDTEWKNIDATESVITGGEFIDSSFTEVDFADSILTKVVFKNSKFTNVRFNRGTLKNVKFINSEFDDVTFRSLNLSEIEIEASTLTKVNFHRASIKIKASKSNFKNVRFIDLKNSSLTFTKSELDVDFSRSTIDKLEITDSKLNEPGGGNTTIKELILRDNRGDRIGFGDSSIQRATIENADMTDQIIGIVRTSVKDLLIVNSKGEVAAIKATIGKIKILNSPKVLIDVDEATAESFYISGTTIKEGLFEKFKAKKLEFENVTLDGKMNFRNAQVDQFINKNTTQTPKAIIDLSGSNIKF